MFDTISIIGGDLRQLTVARLLRAEGYHVFLYGFDKDDSISDDIDTETDLDYILGADIIVLPVPVTFDGVTVNSPYSDNPLCLEELLDNVNPSAVIFGGQIRPALEAELNERGIAYRDYLNREELAIRNAVPTALAIKTWIFYHQRVLVEYKLNRGVVL